MRARAWLLLILAACGPKVGDASESVATGETSSTAATTTTTTTASTTIDPDPTTSSEGAGDPISSSVDTTTGETCVPGTFVGLVTGGSESYAFQSCETGEYSWFVGGAACSSPLWVRVEGELCGPGSYGHLGGADYELRGEIVEGPCAAGCDGEPDPATCGSFPMLCPLVECLLVQQDCPADERCVPTVIDDGPPWYGAACVPAPSFPRKIGDACTSDSSWRDNCEPSAFCVADDRGVGTCAAICDPDDVGACGADTCWPCDFVEPPALAGVCAATEVAC